MATVVQGRALSSVWQKEAVAVSGSKLWRYQGTENRGLVSAAVMREPRCCGLRPAGNLKELTADIVPASSLKSETVLFGQDSRESQRVRLLM